jgi:hypothetical protein
MLGKRGAKQGEHNHRKGLKFFHNGRSMGALSTEGQSAPCTVVVVGCILVLRTSA